jgi:hypothetical protein
MKTYITVSEFTSKPTTCDFLYGIYVFGQYININSIDRNLVSHSFAAPLGFLHLS